MKKLAVILLSSLLLCACTQKNIVNDNGPVTPETENKTDINIEWTDIMDNMNEEIQGNPDYSSVVNFQIAGSEDGKTLELTVIVADDSSSSEVVENVLRMIRYIADEISSQDFSYSGSSQDSYGGYFESHDLKVIAEPESGMDNQLTWYINQNIPAGSNDELQTLK